MPYIIEILHPWADEKEPARRARTRRAVATLDDARDYVTGLMPFPENGHKTTERVGNDLSAMGEAGGSIGPLPDGTVIEVQHLPIMSLAAHIAGRDYSWGFKDAEIIDAFNATQV